MKRAQIVCIGASTTYGVGGSIGGWADVLKQDLHSKMYGGNPQGEVHEVYNLGVPGATVAQQQERTKVFLETAHKPDRQLIAIFQGGANNAKSVGEPESFVSTPEEYEAELRQLLGMLTNTCDQVICLGLLPMNQDKVMPIVKDNETKTRTYFPNDRIKLFEGVFQKVAAEMSAVFMPLFADAEAAGWVENLQFQDGIHPNDKGHQWIYDRLRPKLAKFIL